MTRARSYAPKARQRGEFVKQHRDSEPDVTLTGVTLGKESPSGKAVLVTINGEEMWMPLSQVKRMVRTQNQGQDEITITAWIAGEKGLK